MLGGFERLSDYARLCSMTTLLPRPEWPTAALRSVGGYLCAQGYNGRSTGEVAPRHPEGSQTCRKDWIAFQKQHHGASAPFI